MILNHLKVTAVLNSVINSVTGKYCFDLNNFFFFFNNNGVFIVFISYKFTTEQHLTYKQLYKTFLSNI